MVYIFVLVISLLVFGDITTAETSESCDGQWSAWDGCVRNAACPRPAGLESFSKTAKTWDIGRRRMDIIKALKNTETKKKEDCLQHGTCPYLAQRKDVTEVICDQAKIGFAGEYPCHNIDLMAYVNLTTLTKEYTVPVNRLAGNDIWGWTDEKDGEMYALVGSSVGTSFVRVTKPEKPEVLGFLPTSTFESSWRDIKTVRNYAYIVSEAPYHGLQIFDLTRLRGRTAADYEILEVDILYEKFGNAHNVIGNPEGEYVYVVGATQYSFYETNCNGGLHMVDVRNPLEPKFAGCYSEDGYTHDAQCEMYSGPDYRYINREICFCFNEDTVTIVDVTVKSYPTLISKVGYSGWQYTHQGWVPSSQRILLLDDELDEVYSSYKNTTTYIWDIQNLKEPVLRGAFISSKTVIDHNLYIKDDIVYQSNYQAGLRLLYLDEANYELKEMAYFDAYPQSDEAVFAGTWSVYPYFKADHVVLNSIEYGLYVVQPRMRDIRRDIEELKTEAGRRERRREVLQADGTCVAEVESENCKAPKC